MPKISGKTLVFEKLPFSIMKWRITLSWVGFNECMFFREIQVVVLKNDFENFKVDKLILLPSTKKEYAKRKIFKMIKSYHWTIRQTVDRL